MFPFLVPVFSLSDVSSPLSLSSWSLRVSCFLLFPYFPFGSSSALLSVLSSDMFCRWAFPFLARSRFLVPPFLVFSLLTVVGAFVSAFSQVVLFLLSRLGPSGSFPLGGVPYSFLLRCCSLPSLYSGFFVRCVCLLSLCFLVLCVRSLAPLSEFFRGFSLCPVRSCRISLACPAAFSPGLRSLRFPSFSFSGIFLRGLLVSLCSLLSGVFLFFCFCWEFFVFFFCSCLFCLSCPCMRRFPLRGILACFFSLFFHYSRFFFFFCLPFIFTKVVPVLLFWCFRFGPVVSPSSLVSYVFAVFSFSGVSSFSSLQLSSLFLLCFRFPTFSAGSESLWRRRRRVGGGGGSHSSSLLRFVSDSS